MDLDFSDLSRTSSTHVSYLASKEARVRHPILLLLFFAYLPGVYVGPVFLTGPDLKNASCRAVLQSRPSVESVQPAEALDLTGLHISSTSYAKSLCAASHSFIPVFETVDRSPEPAASTF